MRLFESSVSSVKGLSVVNEPLISVTKFIPLVSIHAVRVSRWVKAKITVTPTPSAAAELAVYDVRLLQETLADIHGDMANRIVRKVQEKRMLVKQKKLVLERFHPRFQLQQKRLRADELAEKLSNSMKDIMNRKRQQVALAAQRLKGLSPVERLEGGYSVVSRPDGTVVKEISQVNSGQDILVDVTDGTITALVQDVKKRRNI